MIRGAARGNQNPGKESLSVKELSKQYPLIKKVLKDHGVPVNYNESLSMGYLCEEAGVDASEIFDILDNKINQVHSEIPEIETITIVPGVDKSGKTEYISEITFKKGEIIAVAGPTGSGKTQLLSDIEGMVQGDSPSKRKILINNNELDDDFRLNCFVKPIVQISQSMNYLLDLTVKEFLDFHIESRNIDKSKKINIETLNTACELCGEPFGFNDRIVTLSGGQARALMIADSLIISKAPVILVDEIENAGIDRQKAVNMLFNKSVITFISTHDPLIALLADKRLILKNGGISQIITRTHNEEKSLSYLMTIDKDINLLKENLRSGKYLEIVTQ